MQPICTHTISIQSSKPSHAYPIVRLPREFRELAGSQAEIYKTEHQGKLAFLVTVDKPVDNSCLLAAETDTQSRLSGLESQIAELKSLLLLNESTSIQKIKKEAPESGFEPESEPRQGSAGTLCPSARSARS
jgi:hypothetical protein